jgi:hypothetical protein
MAPYLAGCMKEDNDGDFLESVKTHTCRGAVDYYF